MKLPSYGLEKRLISPPFDDALERTYSKETISAWHLATMNITKVHMHIAMKRLAGPPFFKLTPIPTNRAAPVGWISHSTPYAVTLRVAYRPVGRFNQTQRCI